MEIRTYSPKMVNIIFSGMVVKGWNTLTISPGYPMFRQINGIRNKNTRVLVGNTASTIAISVPQTSMLNDVFEQIVSIDARTGGGRIEVMVRDVMGHEVFSSSDAYIEAQAERGYKESLGTRTWKLNCLSSKWETSGNDWNAGSILSSLMSSI